MVFKFKYLKSVTVALIARDYICEKNVKYLSMFFTNNCLANLESLGL